MDDQSRKSSDVDEDEQAGKDDCFAPPREPCECYCLHCRRTFMSDQIWFQTVIGDKHLSGFWMCPTPNCDGKGFTFDIFPTDPSHPANDGWYTDDCEDVELDFEDEGMDEFDDSCEEIDAQEMEYDPDEPKYKALDEELGAYDDDIEGEEWKYGLAPGERPAEPEWGLQARREWEEEQKRYDEPDERPRTLDWTGREDRERQFDEDDIPF